MKIRTSFVSNSSSSSYIVDIKGISLDEFYNTIISEYSWDFFEIDAIKEEVNNYCDKVNSFTAMSNLAKIWREQAKKYKEKLDDVNTDRELVDFVFYFRGNVNLEETGSGIRMIGTTSMHNNFGDMPKIMRELTLFFMMDTDYKVKCKRIDTQ